MENDVHFRHYLEVVKRRKFHFIIPTVVVFLAGIAVALLLPSVYKASASIAIESPAVSENLVHSTVSGYIEQRLANLRSRVLTKTNLLDIIESSALYTDLKAENTTQILLEEMRKNITIETVPTVVQIEKHARTMPLTTSFTVSFEGKEPDHLAEVANELAALFLRENARGREERARTTTQFLEKQLESLRTEIQHTEKKLAAFKEKHLNQLPELMQLNLKTMDQLEREIDFQQKHINDLTNRKIYLEGQLALLEPTMYKVTADGRRILTPKEELSVLRSQYLALSASLSKQHPDVVRLKKKLEALEGEVGTQQEVRQLQHELFDKEHQLEVLNKRVSPRHPDAVRLRKEVVLLREQVQNLSKKQTVLKADSEKPENPAYINLQTRVEGTQMDMEAAKKKLVELQEKYEEYRERIENTPQVEQQYLELRRDYSNAKASYDKTVDRLRVAREATGLEEDSMSEKFTLVREATTPLEPYKPNRPLLILFGLFLAVSSGIGIGSISEYMDHSVHTADQLAEIAGHKVLTVIPYWETSQDIRSKRRRLWAFVGSTIALVVIGVAAVNFLYWH